MKREKNMYENSILVSGWLHFYLVEILYQHLLFFFQGLSFHFPILFLSFLFLFFLSHSTLLDFLSYLYSLLAFSSSCQSLLCLFLSHQAGSIFRFTSSRVHSTTGQRPGCVCPQVHLTRASLHHGLDFDHPPHPIHHHWPGWVHLQAHL